MKKTLLLSITLIAFLAGNTQVLRWSPAFIQETSATISISANAIAGNKGLADHLPATDVYVHIGAITSLSSNAADWKYVKFTWATTPGAANAPVSGNNEWTFTISGGLRNFFGITNSTEKIQKIAILFRSGNGNKVLRNDDGSDMYIPVYDNGNFVRIDEPISKPYFNRTLQAIDKKIGESISITGNSNGAAELKLFFNGNIIGTASGASTISANTLLQTGGTQKIIAEGQFPGGILVKDSIQFFVPGPASVKPLPDGIGDGITYERGDTSAYLVLYAPGKGRVSVLGDFNNWTESETFQMNKTPDGSRFWIRIGKLIPGAEYAYQFQIDGTLKVADFNTEKVLDPNNDNTIPATTYPGLKSYPTGKTSGIVSVLHPGKPSYSWKIQNFKRPEKQNLIIYELLLRDFVATRNFQTLKDTLSYLKKLGVNTIGLMPFSEFEGNLSWGYNPNYFFAPDKFYGTENAIRDFIDECHRQGIAVIMDMVLNHAFGSSPHALMYWDGAGNKPATDNPWLNPDAKHPFNVGYDFNHESSATKDLVARVVRHWLTRYKIDGFRWDLSKGFTQTNNPNNVSAWGNYDASRVATWKRIYDTMQAVSPGSYCILEHFADNSEERELANYGMMLWGNGNFNFNQATMGYAQDSDFGGISAQRRGWEKQHLVGYMESHDEERLMYKNLNFGNQSVSYSTRDSVVALKRMGQAAAFWAMIPGPKMLWQFGEIGFPYSINTCTNGTVNNNCRLDNKPLVWGNFGDVSKRALYDVYANLLRLRQNPSLISTFTGNNYTMDLAGTVKTIQVNTDSLKIVVVGNFDLSAKTVNVTFPSSGTWHSYLTKTSINVSGTSSSISLQPGEYHVYLNRDLSNSLVTALFNPVMPELDLQTIIYPNPVKNELNLTYVLPKSGEVVISLMSANGIKLGNLFKGVQSSGLKNISFPGSALAGKLKSGGIYYLNIQTNQGQSTVRFLKTF
jgi:1,4-alpha-glucan branching enzyme